MSESCITPEQVAKDVCIALMSELYGIIFLDTTKAGFEHLAVTAVNTRVGIQSLIDSELGFTLISQSIEKNDADAVVAEIAGVQVFIKYGEMRAKMRVKANYATWEQMSSYNHFTGKEAYLLTENNKITFINDGDTTPLANGLPLGMVQVDTPPLFTNGADPAEFYMMFNINANRLSGLERSDLDFPVHTLNPVKSTT